MSQRIEKLTARLHKGIDKTMALFNSLSPEQWDQILYQDPYPWTIRDLLAHFFSSEEGLLQLAQNIATGGPGTPEGFNYDAYNAAGQKRLADVSREQLLSDLVDARQKTIAWVEGLAEEDLDRQGLHPALGQITLEEFINAIYGHHLLHIRELKPLLE